MAGTQKKDCLAGIEAMKVTQCLLSEQRKGDVPWFLPSSALQSSDSAFHWLTSPGHQKAREPGKGSFLMQSKAEIGKDWTKQTGKTAIAI